MAYYLPSLPKRQDFEPQAIPRMKKGAQPPQKTQDKSEQETSLHASLVILGRARNPLHPHCSLQDLTLILKRRVTQLDDPYDGGAAQIFPQILIECVFQYFELSTSFDEPGVP